MEILYKLTAINEDTDEEIGRVEAYSLGSIMEQMYKIEHAVNLAIIEEGEDKRTFDEKLLDFGI